MCIGHCLVEQVTPEVALSILDQCMIKPVNLDRSCLSVDQVLASIYTLIFQLSVVCQQDIFSLQKEPIISLSHYLPEYMCRLTG